MIIVCAALSGFLAVALGAFGAHGLKNTLPESSLSVYETAVQYHFWHTLALLAVGILIQQGWQLTSLRLSAGLFGAGIVLFSGSLYLLAVTQIRWLGAVTPLGGLLLLAGWAALAAAAWKSLP